MKIRHRKYKNYQQYLGHQAQKLNIGVRKKISKFMPESIPKVAKSFEKRIGKFGKYLVGKKVLCLGARTGAEVVAFINLGFEDSIGIDINPGKNNEYVIKGDFHNMKFEDDTFDIVYCNCIDHAWDMGKLSKEIYRVLKEKSYLLLEIDHLIGKSYEDRKLLLEKSSKYESIMWGDFEDIKKGFKEFKFVDSFQGANPGFLAAVFRK